MRFSVVLRKADSVRPCYRRGVKHTARPVSHPDAAQEPVDRQRMLTGFYARGEAAWQEYQRTGISHPLDEVFDRIQGRIDAKRVELLARQMVISIERRPVELTAPNSFRGAALTAPVTGLFRAKTSFMSAAGVVRSPHRRARLLL
jgi:hypothetical protein